MTGGNLQIAYIFIARSELLCRGHYLDDLDREGHSFDPAKRVETSGKKAGAVLYEAERTDQSR